MIASTQSHLDTIQISLLPSTWDVLPALSDGLKVKLTTTFRALLTLRGEQNEALSFIFRVCCGSEVRKISADEGQQKARSSTPVQKAESCNYCWDLKMAVKILAKVWEGYPGESSVDLLALLALADWSDDEGCSFPSIAALAKKCRIGPRQAQRLVHRLIDTGLVSVIGNANGGKPGASRRYRINLDRLTGVKDVRGDKNAADGCHLSRETGGQNDTLYVIDTPLNVKEVSARKKSEITLKQFLDTCKASGEKSIPENDPVFEYAETVGLDHEMVSVCWQEFKDAFLIDESKRQKDWRAHFRNAVRRNWYKLWYMKEGEPVQWTTAGEQARRAAS